ncbi:GNAT family N-acetyltransferase [Marinimicrobium sp. C6131]|uniref:GNAT family N-acetyltransferase n=1 Tax=Marinimicrobium sp. C6131 TaxID=3022676 RepID=UPI00223C90EC|nr:GNAT family N-acetyltransferase [Marinimicrobium sp. C6131]UZJ42898.1 GNAT family N-acetyltransferase [Marinimicrobium sp. C6131]
MAETATPQSTAFPPLADVAVPTSLVIEPLTPSTAGLSGFIDAIAHWHHEHCLARGLTSSLERRAEQLHRHLTREAIPVTLIARKGTEVLGSVSLVRYQASAGGEQRLWLSNLYVPEALRGEGLGSVLVDKACRYAHEQGETELWLFTDNQQDFYQKRGWQPGGEARVSQSDVDIFVRRL